jgi:hypothetical protein
MITIVLKECGFKKFLTGVFNVSSISNQSFADASSTNITRLTLPMPMACQEHLKEKKLYQFVLKFSGNWSTRRKTTAGKAKSRTFKNYFKLRKDTTLNHLRPLLLETIVHEQTIVDRSKPGPSFQLYKWLYACHVLTVQ